MTTTRHTFKANNRPGCLFLSPHKTRCPILRAFAKGGVMAGDSLSFPRTFLLILAILLTATLPAQAQWDIQESNTTASLRGIHNVGGRSRLGQRNRRDRTPH